MSIPPTLHIFQSKPPPELNSSWLSARVLLINRLTGTNFQRWAEISPRVDLSFQPLQKRLLQRQDLNRVQPSDNHLVKLIAITSSNWKLNWWVAGEVTSDETTNSPMRKNSSFYHHSFAMQTIHQSSDNSRSVITEQYTLMSLAGLERNVALHHWTRSKPIRQILDRGKANDNCR